MNASCGTGAGQHMPRLVFWEITKGCNLRCAHCRASATELASPRDLPTSQCQGFIDQIAAFASPIVVFSGGEPLYRADILQLARYATGKGLRVALASNGTLVTADIAQKIVESGIQRVSISLDGSNADTHDGFRGIPGSFDAALYGLRNLKRAGIPVQISVSIARHNADQLPAMLEMVRTLGADALDTFLLVPVCCGVELAASEMLRPEEYEHLLQWCYDQAAEGGVELHASCAPHYSRIVEQRRAAAHLRRENGSGTTTAAEASIAPTDIMMPGASGMVLRPSGGLSGDRGARSSGCAAGSGVCFVSFEGEVYPCGYLPAVAGDLRKQSFAEVWNSAGVLSDLRQTDKLEGKCGCCEFRNICMGCRARAYAASGNYMAEEPFCRYEPMAMTKK